MFKEFSIYKWLSNKLSPLESLGDVKLCPEFSNDTCPPRSKKSAEVKKDITLSRNKEINKIVP